MEVEQSHGHPQLDIVLGSKILHLSNSLRYQALHAQSECWYFTTTGSTWINTISFRFYTIPQHFPLQRAQRDNQERSTPTELTVNIAPSTGTTAQVIPSTFQAEERPCDGCWGEGRGCMHANFLGVDGFCLPTSVVNWVDATPLSLTTHAYKIPGESGGLSRHKRSLPGIRATKALSSKHQHSNMCKAYLPSRGGRCHFRDAVSAPWPHLQHADKILPSGSS